MSGISLTASMRSNLLSLQNISGQVSSTQNKLATGNKVNSAIDNPSSYYTALSLNNRADDLNALLDSMGQAVSTIKAATTALESATEFLEQAKAVANQALEQAIPSKSFFEEKEDVAAVVSTWDELKAALDSGKQGNIVIYGNIEAKDTINLKAGQNLVGISYYGIEELDVDKFSQLTFDLEAIGKTEAIKTNADNLTIADLSIKAHSRETAYSVVLKFSNRKNITLENIDILVDNEGMDYYSENNQATSNIIGGGESVIIKGKNNIFNTGMKNNTKELMSTGIIGSNVKIYGELNIHMSQYGNRGISGGTLELFDDAKLNIQADGRAINSSHITLRDNSEMNIAVKQQLGLSYGSVTLEDKSQLNINSSHSALEGLPGNTLSVNINSPQALLNVQSLKAFTNTDNNLTFNAVAGSQIGLNGKLYKTDTVVNDNTMEGNTMPQGFVEVAGATVEEVPTLSWVLEQNAERDISYDYKSEAEDSSQQYIEIINQYDSLIKDASYKGINLLQADKLTVKFNETNTADLSVQGKDMSSQALGFTVFGWETQGDIADSLAEIASALQSIRNYSSELGNNYSIITTRQDFTESLVNVLTEGADKLTLADMNEESANMLALQTRQQLAINSLSLASQASQSILKLF